MEDEWYSGGDTLAQGHGGAIAATTGAAAATRGPYGDSFTPPTSQGGMAGQQVGLWCRPRPVYLLVAVIFCTTRGGEERPHGDVL